jgi:cytochrome c oxidase subunit 1
MTTAMLMAIGFLVTFLVGGVTGVMLASPPIDFFVHTTYFVVAHFHSVVMALVLAGMAGIYYWHPKITGRMLREGIGKIQFWLLVLGSQVAFVPQYVLGLRGMPRRIATYPASEPWHLLNVVSTIGAGLIAASFIFFVVNVFVSWKSPVLAGDNPWDAHSLEWWTTSPPPPHNFHALPLIRSERPTWDANHPEAGALSAHGTPSAPPRGAPLRTG